jgi:hypothetical protein
MDPNHLPNVEIRNHQHQRSTVNRSHKPLHKSLVMEPLQNFLAWNEDCPEQGQSAGPINFLDYSERPVITIDTGLSHI